jgi:hypothetical protein
MCPIDPTPYAGEVMHPPTEREFPKARPDQTQRDNSAPDISHRPELPDHPEQMAADIEDEEADPVVDSGPGIADGVQPLVRQRG